MTKRLILICGILFLCKYASSQIYNIREKEVSLNEVTVKQKKIKTYTQKGRSPLFPITEYRVQVVDTLAGMPSRAAYINKVYPFSSKSISVRSLELKLDPFNQEAFDVYIFFMQPLGDDTIIQRRLIKNEKIEKGNFKVNFELGDFVIQPQEMFIGLEIVPKNVVTPILYQLYKAMSTENFYQYRQYADRSYFIKAPGTGVIFTFKMNYYEM